MSSKLRVVIDYDKGDHFFNDSSNDYPFTNRANLKELCSFYQLELLKIELFCNVNLDWQGLFFHKKIDGKVYIFSGGRFGFSGFVPVMNENPVSSYLNLIEIELNKIEIGSCSLSISFLADLSKESNEIWQTSSVSYLVANTQESTDENGLCFKKAITRSNLSRNLKKAKAKEFICKEVFDFEALKLWHESCHLPRIKELNGKIWDIELLSKCIDNGTASLVCVFDKEENMLGGCYILKSRLVLEFFMMSSTRENQILGVNSVLIEFLYLMANRENMNFINWQASNPPEGPLVRFKKEWNAKEYNFNIYNKNFSKYLDQNFIETHFKDCYIFPFSNLKLKT
ncbi:hypothetical protein N9523_07010 [Flavobacteriaceae bacterium]|nr:hypothetical protein [Flavobacteriaceae bacterium]